MAIDLKGNPFYLDDEKVKWVETTLEGMSVKEKVGQLFFPMGMLASKKEINSFAKEICVGGAMLRPMGAKGMINAHSQLQENSKIPLFLAANLESGGFGATVDGTNFAMPLAVAATDDDNMGYALGKISASEGASVGCNLSFAPIVDIDNEFRSPVTNLRTFGSDPDRVIRMGKEYIKAAKEEGVAVSIKHFPGDGMDERDQHYVTTVNTLGADEWTATYGRIYKELIADGAETVMVGHIAQPSWVKKLNPDATDEVAHCPASISSELLTGLLRTELGFNGLILTDASSMLGFTVAMPRAKSVPLSIANGCDMFLFNKDLDEDFEFMMAGVEDGTISAERLDEAITRILATKSMLNLPEKHKKGETVPTLENAQKILSNSKHIAWSRECAEKAVTLVKDTQGLLPLSAKKTRRVYLNVIEADIQKNSPFAVGIKERLEKEGFEVTLRDRTLKINLNKITNGNIAHAISLSSLRFLKEIMGNTQTFKDQYDLIIMVANTGYPSGTSSGTRLNWKSLMGMGDDAPWYTSEVPSMFISTANPYHLLDAPMFKTFINAYTGTDVVLDAVMNKIMGRSEFIGKSPVDAFCGKTDTRL